VFALANALAASDRLSAADAAWVTRANALGEARYTVPPSEFYDRELYPGAHAWFRADATDLVHFASSYLPMLGRYGVACVERRSSNPGTVVWSDSVQVVVVPSTGS
jgi:hypothetical protein